MIEQLECLKHIGLLQKHKEELGAELVFDYENEQLKKAYSELEQAFINAAVAEAEYLTSLKQIKLC